MARILLVEDERITAEYLRDVIGDLGHTVAVVSTGPDAIARVRDSTPDLILMDIRLQGLMDGTEAAQVIRTAFRIPVIFLTALNDRETRARADRTSPLGYLTKPVEEFELLTKIELALEHLRDSGKSRGAGA